MYYENGSNECLNYEWLKPQSTRRKTAQSAQELHTKSDSYRMRASACEFNFTLRHLALRTRTITLSRFARLFLLRPHGPA